jgi:hypothetical protein
LKDGFGLRWSIVLWLAGIVVLFADFLILSPIRMGDGFFLLLTFIFGRDGPFSRLLIPIPQLSVNGTADN